MKTKEKVQQIATPLKITITKSHNLLTNEDSLGYHLEDAIGRKIYVHHKDLAELIERAVNSHEALLKSAKNLCDLAKYGAVHGDAHSFEMLRHAISQAEGRPTETEIHDYITENPPEVLG